MEKITLKRYEQSKLSGLKMAAITRRIREGRTLPGVYKIERFGRFYLLSVKNNSQAGSGFER